MTSHPWNDEMSHLLYKIERETENSICKLKKSLKRCGLQFDGKFRRYFLKATDNRLSETFDRFEIDDLEKTQIHHRSLPDAIDSRSSFRDGIGRWSDSRERSRSRIRQNRSRSQRPRRSRSRSRRSVHSREKCNKFERSGSHAPHHKSHNFKQISSIKDRLGTKLKRHSSPNDRKPKEKPSKKQPKDLTVKSNEENVIKKPKIDDSHEFEQPMDMGDLQVILNKCLTIPIQSTDLDDFIFCCVYCQDDENCPESCNIEEIYAHWLSLHTEIPDVKPFAFSIVVQSSACFYCEKIGTLQQQLKHHKSQHRNRSIAIVNPSNRKQCLFCGYSGTNWSDHFEINHKMFQQMPAINPFALTQDTLQKLLSIEIHQKRQCGHCEEIFEAEHQLECHTLNEHPNEEIQSKVIKTSQEMYLICDICTEHLSPDTFLTHLEEHSFEFKCSKCEFITDDLVEMEFHENQQHQNNALNSHYLEFTERLKSHFFRTKAIFGNGLHATKYNLFGTDFDDYNQFRYMIETMIDIKVKKYGWLMKKQQISDQSEAVTGNDNCSISSGEFMLSTLASSTAFNPPLQNGRKKSTIASNKSYSRELHEQTRIVKNVCIHGVPRRENENLRTIVLRVFAKIGADISSNDIAVVHRLSKSDPLIIVKFANTAAKQSVMLHRCSRDVQSSDVMGLLPGVVPSKVHIFSHLTHFFEDLRKIAKQALNEQRLYSYCLTKHGFLVRRSRNSPEKYIFSRNELKAYIFRTDRNQSIPRSYDGN